MMFRQLILIFALICACPGPFAANAETRRWTDNSGQFSLEAEMIEVRDGVVRLKKKADGGVISVPLKRLSLLDQQYVKAQQRRAEDRGKKAAAALSRDVAAAWTKAGATIVDTSKNPQMMGTGLFKGPLITVFRAPTAGLANLPAPKAPFGLLIYLSVTDDTVDELVRLKNLQCLMLTNANGITDVGLAKLAKLEGLTVLLIGQMKSVGTALGELSRLPELHTLMLVGSTEISRPGLIILSGSPKLQTLAIGGLEQVSDELLDALRNLPKLKSLTLDSQDIGDAQLQKLGQLPWLKELNLRGVGPSATPKTFDLISQLSQISSLAIKGAQIRGDDIAKLVSLKELGALELIGAEVSDEAMERLSQLVNLQSLRLSDSQVSEQGLGALAELKGLRHLNLPSVGVTDAVLSSLSNLQGMKTLQIPNDAKVNKTAVDALKKSLPNCEIRHRHRIRQ